MGIDYNKCDMCKQCYADIEDNYPYEVEGTDKYVCPECLEEWLEKKGIEITYITDEDGNEEPMYLDGEECIVKKEYNPFPPEEKMISEQRVKEAIGEITFIRGITPENNVHNAVNRFKQGLKEKLGLEE